MNYSRFFTPISKARKPSPIRETSKLLVNPSPKLVFLAAGFPNQKMFPFKSATFTLIDGQELHLNPEEMNAALQYGPSLGYPPLVKQLKSLTQQLHNPPNWSNSDLIVTAGGQYGLSNSIEMLVKPGDYFTTPEPTYSGTLSIVDPLKPKYLTIEVDEHGMKPNSLLQKLENVHKNKTMENPPKVLYVNPTASNPCGTSLTLSRKKEIYKIACDYDLIILEDDPYYFVQFDANPSPTFLSLDVEGRVIRIDSFSKILSSGIRIGYVTGPKELVERICLHSQSNIMHAPGMSQVMVSNLLDLWGDNFFKHTEAVQNCYKEQRNLMLNAAEKHLKDLCKWNIPTGGMFIWFEVPGLKDTSDMITKRGLENNIVLLPGKAFLCDDNTKSNYLRASYSIATQEQMDVGFERLAKMIREEIIIQSKK